MNTFYNMMNGSKGQQVPANNNIMNVINSRFGNIGNAAKFLNQLISGKGLSVEDLARQGLQGKTFDNATINQFRAFAKQAGLSDKQINAGLKEAGIIK